MKNIIGFLGIFLGLNLFLSEQVRAYDIVPQFVSVVQTDTIGVYKVPNEIRFYSNPDETSELISTVKWSKEGIEPNTINAQDLFIILVPEDNVGFMSVNSEDSSWIQVIYNNSTGEMAWIKKDSLNDYYTWEAFFEEYGRKYGLKILNGAVDDEKNIYTKPDSYSKAVGKVNKFQKINLHSISGNWAYISIIDFENKTKTGYVRWREDDGTKYFFPDIP